MSTDDERRSEHVTSEHQSLSLHSIKRNVRRHWRGAGLIVLLSIALASLYTAFRTPLYRVKSMVLIENSSPSIVPGVEMGLTLTREVTEAQRVLACSKRVLDSALKIARAARPSDPELNQAGAAEALYYPLETIIEGQLLVLYCYNPDPVRARDLANAWMQAFVDEMKLREARGTKSAADFLNDEVPKLREKWWQENLKLQDYVKENRYDPKLLESDPVRKRYADFSEQLTAAQRRQDGLRGEAAELESAKEDPEVLFQLPRARKDERILGYERLIQQQQTKLLEAKARYQEEADLIQKVEEPLRKLEEYRKEAAGLLAKQIRIEQRLADGEAAAAKAHFEAAKLEMEDLNSKAAKYQSLAANVEMARKLYDEMWTRWSGADISKRFQQSYAQPWEFGEVPSAPYLPSWPKSIALGLVIGLMLAGAFIYFREVTDSTVHSDSQLQDTLGVNVLGTVPLLDPALAGNPYHLLESHPRILASDNLRSIRMSLILACSSKRGLVIVVTSPGQSDGKSVIASNLAVAFAEQGRKTLLIDADVYKATLSIAWDANTEYGLSSLLNGARSFAELARPSGVENLTLISAGKKLHNPAKLWEAAGIDETLEKARSDFDVTVVDSPPLLAVSDAHILAQKCDAALLVVRSRQTQFGHVRRAIDVLVRAHARQSFFVVNGLDASDAEAAGYGHGYGGYGYGGYGYGYGYGHGHRDKEEESDASHEPEAGDDSGHSHRPKGTGHKSGK